MDSIRSVSLDLCDCVCMCVCVFVKCVCVNRLEQEIRLKPGFLPRVLRDVGTFLVNEGHSRRHIPGHGCETLDRIGVVESSKLLKLLCFGVLFGILFYSVKRSYK